MKTKIFITVLAVGFLLVGFGVAGAATDWNGDNIFNGTVNWFKKGIRIGEQGSGGVTFFNGTIVNETTTDGTDNPVTFGDNVRIDGEIWRGETAGPGDNMPVKINDDLTIAGSVSGISIDEVDNLRTDLTYLNDSKLATAGGTVSGDLTVDKDMSVTGDTVLSGDLTQYWESNGALKAGVLYSPLNSIVSSFGGTITPTKAGTGDYYLQFDFPIVGRYFHVTPSAITNVNCVGYADVGYDVSGQTLHVKCFVTSSGAASDQYVYVLIY